MVTKKKAQIKKTVKKEPKKENKKVAVKKQTHGYEKRFDKRGFDELRPISMDIGVLDNADGSARVQVGDTVAIAGVFGPQKVRPKHMEDTEKLIIKCYYDLMSFSVTDRARPGPSRRSIELGLVIKNAVEKAIFVEEYPKSMIQLFIEIPQADAGSRCAAVIASSLALADAGIMMRGLVPAVAVGKIDDKICVDITKHEEDYHEGGGATDIPIAYIPALDEITLLQLDGKVTKNELMQAINAGTKACKKIHEMMKQAIKKKYEVIEK
ncbi:Exosome complex component Rrp41 [Candidatus Tiddalikarchaeum anstoanum]|nr:Exosome complex component Rrp41 [Candidatus Tiddalikarchaeum anstoanum]